MKNIEQNDIQLEINFDNIENSFRKYLNNGKFFVIYELPLFDNETQPVEGMSVREAEIFASSVEDKYNLPACIGFRNGSEDNEPLKLLKCISEVIDKHITGKALIYISGRDVSLSHIEEILKLARSLKLNNIVPVSGNAVKGEDYLRTSKRFFTESVSTLEKIRHMTDSEIFPGCVVNPFMYTPGSAFTQYYKLIKKINMGAKFIVTQFGWDMRKYQELQWYLNYRDYFIPSVARLVLLTPELVEDILNGKYPGIRISPDFQLILEQENSFSRKQFEAAQWRRLQIQAAGCKLLGYNAVQISGLYTPKQIEIAHKRIADALEEFNNFEDWREAYLAHIGRCDMSPYPYNFYLFHDLLGENPSPDTFKMNYTDMPECTSLEKFHYILSSKLLKQVDTRRSDEFYFLKKLIAGCKNCKVCRLPHTHYICPEKCPKHLSNGPCGGAKANGLCEVNDKQECIHVARMKLALWRKDIDSLEEIFIEQSD